MYDLLVENLHTFYLEEYILSRRMKIKFQNYKNEDFVNKSINWKNWPALIYLHDNRPLTKEV